MQSGNNYIGCFDAFVISGINSDSFVKLVESIDLSHTDDVTRRNLIMSIWPTSVIHSYTKYEHFRVKVNEITEESSAIKNIDILKHHIKDCVTFCFANGGARVLHPKNNEYPSTQFHTFVLTGYKGERRFGGTLVIWERLNKYITLIDELQNIQSLPDWFDYNEYSNYYAPLSICLLSSVPIFSTIYNVLKYKFLNTWVNIREIFKTDYTRNNNTKYFLKEWSYLGIQAIANIKEELLFHSILPPKGVYHVNWELSKSVVHLLFQPPPNSQLPLCQVPVLSLFNFMTVNSMLSLYIALIKEMSVIFLSRSPCLLSIVCESFRCLLFPLDICMIYIPLLPFHMVELSASPTPFLIGLLIPDELEDNLTLIYETLNEYCPNANIYNLDLYDGVSPCHVMTVSQTLIKYFSNSDIHSTSTLNHPNNADNANFSIHFHPTNLNINNYNALSDSNHLQTGQNFQMVTSSSNINSHNQAVLEIPSRLRKKIESRLIVILDEYKLNYLLGNSTKRSLGDKTISTPSMNEKFSFCTSSTSIVYETDKTNTSDNNNSNDYISIDLLGKLEINSNNSKVAIISNISTKPVSARTHGNCKVSTESNVMQFASLEKTIDKTTMGKEVNSCFEISKLELNYLENNATSQEFLKDNLNCITLDNKYPKTYPSSPISKHYRCEYDYFPYDLNTKLRFGFPFVDIKIRSNSPSKVEEYQNLSNTRFNEFNETIYWTITPKEFDIVGENHILDNYAHLWTFNIDKKSEKLSEGDMDLNIPCIPIEEELNDHKKKIYLQIQNKFRKSFLEFFFIIFRGIIFQDFKSPFDSTIFRNNLLHEVHESLKPLLLSVLETQAFSDLLGALSTSMCPEGSHNCVEKLYRMMLLREMILDRKNKSKLLPLSKTYPTPFLSSKLWYYNKDKVIWIKYKKLGNKKDQSKVDLSIDNESLPESLYTEESLKCTFGNEINSLNQSFFGNIEDIELNYGLPTYSIYLSNIKSILVLEIPSIIPFIKATFPSIIFSESLQSSKISSTEVFVIDKSISNDIYNVYQNDTFTKGLSIMEQHKYNQVILIRQYWGHIWKFIDKLFSCIQSNNNMADGSEQLYKLSYTSVFTSIIGLSTSIKLKVLWIMLVLIQLENLKSDSVLEGMAYLEIVLSVFSDIIYQFKSSTKLLKSDISSFVTKILRPIVYLYNKNQPLYISYICLRLIRWLYTNTNDLYTSLEPLSNSNKSLNISNQNDYTNSYTFYDPEEQFLFPEEKNQWNEIFGLYDFEVLEYIYYKAVNATDSINIDISKTKINRRDFDLFLSLFVLKPSLNNKKSKKRSPENSVTYKLALNKHTLNIDDKTINIQIMRAKNIISTFICMQCNWHVLNRKPIKVRYKKRILLNGMPVVILQTNYEQVTTLHEDSLYKKELNNTIKENFTGQGKLDNNIQGCEEHMSNFCINNYSTYIESSKEPSIKHIDCNYFDIPLYSSSSIILQPMAICKFCLNEDFSNEFSEIYSFVLKYKFLCKFLFTGEYTSLNQVIDEQTLVCCPIHKNETQMLPFLLMKEYKSEGSNANTGYQDDKILLNLIPPSTLFSIYLNSSIFKTKRVSSLLITRQNIDTSGNNSKQVCCGYSIVSSYDFTLYCNTLFYFRLCNLYIDPFIPTDDDFSEILFFSAFKDLYNSRNVKDAEVQVNYSTNIGHIEVEYAHNHDYNIEDIYIKTDHQFSSSTKLESDISTPENIYIQDHFNVKSNYLYNQDSKSKQIYNISSMKKLEKSNFEVHIFNENLEYKFLEDNKFFETTIKNFHKFDIIELFRIYQIKCLLIEDILSRELNIYTNTEYSSYTCRSESNTLQGFLNDHSECYVTLEEFTSIYTDSSNITLKELTNISPEQGIIKNKPIYGYKIFNNITYKSEIERRKSI
ncbi:hypothetical protein cand_007570 [Cryptosporidium andersoni]|uniref:UDENN domain-containing protein n=1 Tax=Cryptosporidium andersoni TaxID=117008 RepID=A0A1J4MRE3_9CRYT|nr:hypothetical protein cand_007570 [Cryptosporidium andersoni]